MQQKLKVGDVIEGPYATAKYEVAEVAMGKYRLLNAKDGRDYGWYPSTYIDPYYSLVSNPSPQATQMSMSISVGDKFYDSNGHSFVVTGFDRLHDEILLQCLESKQLDTATISREAFYKEFRSAESAAAAPPTTPRAEISNVVCLSCGNRPKNLRQAKLNQLVFSASCCGKEEHREFPYDDVAKINATGGWTAFLSSTAKRVA